MPFSVDLSVPSVFSMTHLADSRPHCLMSFYHVRRGLSSQNTAKLLQCPLIWTIIIASDRRSEITHNKLIASDPAIVFPAWSKDQVMPCVYNTWPVAALTQAVKPDTGSELRFLPTPPAFRGFLSEYCYAVWHGKTRMDWLPEGKKNLEDVYSFWHDPRMWQTHRHTHTHRHHTTWRLRPRLHSIAWQKLRQLLLARFYNNPVAVCSDCLSCYTEDR